MKEIIEKLRSNKFNATIEQRGKYTIVINFGGQQVGNVSAADLLEELGFTQYYLYNNRNVFEINGECFKFREMDYYNTYINYIRIQKMKNKPI